MSREEDKEEEQLELSSESDDSWQQKEPSFNSLDDEDDFDESDRDSDFATLYTEEEEPEPDYFDDLPEDHLDEPETETSAWEEDAPEDVDEGDAWLELSLESEQETEELVEDDWIPDNFEQSEPEAESPAPTLFEDEQADEPTASSLPPIGMTASAEQEADLPSEDEWEDDEPDYYEDAEQQEVTLPFGLILVGVIALVLLGAGGYGVMQQRAEMQEEVRQLRATLATAASPSEVADTRAASEALTQRNTELESQLQGLQRENSNLKAIVSGLEQQLQAQQEILNKPESNSTPPPVPAAKPKPKPADKPAPKTTARPSPKPVNQTPVATSGGSGWFVNFGSYSQRDTAESWARKLQPAAGKVIVMTGEKDGRTFYRVRVVELPSRSKADTVARSLEQK